MKRVIITGSSGLCATELIHLLTELKDYEIYAVSTNLSAIVGLYPAEKVICLTLHDMEILAHDGHVKFDVLIHFAFSRIENGPEMASSLDYLGNVLKLALNISLNNFIYISSQSVYGQKEKPLWKEETPVSPESMYALGKYAGEVIVKSVLRETSINHTIIRLASVCEKARFLSVFAKNVLSGEPIKVVGGKQTCSLIDVRDVAEALQCVINNSNNLRFSDIYNLSIGENVSVMELAVVMEKTAEKYFNISGEIERKESNICQDIGMDNTRFKNAFMWEPKYDYSDMALSLLNLHSGISKGVPYAFLVKYKDMLWR